MALKTFPVNASAYNIRSKARGDFSCLTHSCEVDEDGFPVRVLCRRVKLDNILADTTQSTDEVPTCPYCAKKVNSRGAAPVS